MQLAAWKVFFSLIFLWTGMREERPKQAEALAIFYNVKFSCSINKANFRGRIRAPSLSPRQSFLINDFANVIYAALICLHYRLLMLRRRESEIRGLLNIHESFKGNFQHFLRWMN